MFITESRLTWADNDKKNKDASSISLMKNKMIFSDTKCKRTRLEAALVNNLNRHKFKISLTSTQKFHDNLTMDSCEPA